MNDPHVERLHYRLERAAHIDYTKAKPLTASTPAFSVEISELRATITVIAHHATIAEARAAIEPFLRVWELDAALRYGPRSLKFVYERSDVIDRQPTPGHYVMTVEPITLKLTGGAVNMVLGLANYPPAPMDIACDATVDLMFARYMLYRDGSTTLADAANYCLTAMELLAAGAPSVRKEAAKILSVEYSVLSTIGRLSATKGGLQSRKAGGAVVEFTSAEKQWLEQAMVALIRRTAEVAHDPAAARPTITMSDFVPL